MSDSLAGRRIVVGVTGGVAAYKTAALVSKCVQSGAEVSVAMTESATKFVGPATFEALTGKTVATGVFENPQHPLGAHIELIREADLLCVAPATANFLAKAASGAADDLVSTLYLSHAGKTLVAPTMNSDMWNKPAVQRNIAQLREDGVLFVEPGEGWLSCRLDGKGRMAEPEEILASIHAALSQG